jgi:hypothetical protein
LTRFFVGLDLGQAADYTAVSILEKLQPEGDEKEHERRRRNRQNVYHIRYLERVRGEPYPVIVSKVVKMMSKLKDDHANLVIDQTGCGRPVFDMFIEGGLDPVGVSIHGGDSTTHEGRNWRVPKRDLVGVLQVLLQTGRLKVASKLALGSILQAEMLNFKVKIDPVTAHDSYSAWREQDHDDLVLSVALAVWWAEQCVDPPVLIVPLIPTVGGSIWQTFSTHLW